MNDNLPTILFILQGPLHVRNFISSGFLKKLLEKVNLVIVVHDGYFDFIRAEAANRTNYELHSLEFFQKGKFRHWLLNSYRTASMVYRCRFNQTYKNRYYSVMFNYMSLSWKRYLSIAPKYIFYGFLGLFLNLEKISRFIEKHIPENKKAADFIESKKPALVFCPTLIHEQKDVELIKAARARGITVVNFVASWDNLTSKGMFLFEPDKIFVWGKEDIPIAQKEHNISMENIIVTGPPHFDQYFNPASIVKRDEFLSQRSIDPSKRMILFAGTSFNKFAEEPEIVIKMAQFLRDKYPNVLIWYRPHPRAMWSERLTSPAFDNCLNVYVDDMVKELISHRKFGFSVDKKMLEFFPSLVNAADGTVSVYSTMVLEASLQGKPSILINFGCDKNGNEMPGKNEWIRTNIHLVPLLKTNGNFLANNFNEFFNGINMLLSGDLSRYSQELRLIGNNIAECSDAKAQQRIIEALQELLLPAKSG